MVGSPGFKWRISKFSTEKLSRSASDDKIECDMGDEGEEKSVNKILR